MGKQILIDEALVKEVLATACKRCSAVTSTNPPAIACACCGIMELSYKVDHGKFNATNTKEALRYTKLVCHKCKKVAYANPLALASGKVSEACSFCGGPYTRVVNGMEYMTLRTILGECDGCVNSHNGYCIPYVAHPGYGVHGSAKGECIGKEYGNRRYHIPAEGI